MPFVCGVCYSGPSDDQQPSPTNSPSVPQCLSASAPQVQKGQRDTVLGSGHMATYLPACTCTYIPYLACGEADRCSGWRGKGALPLGLNPHGFQHDGKTRGAKLRSGAAGVRPSRGCRRCNWAIESRSCGQDETRRQARPACPVNFRLPGPAASRRAQNVETALYTS
jgi:hypothetical protein